MAACGRRAAEKGGIDSCETERAQKKSKDGLGEHICGTFGPRGQQTCPIHSPVQAHCLCLAATPIPLQQHQQPISAEMAWSPARAGAWGWISARCTFVEPLDPEGSKHAQSIHLCRLTAFVLLPHRSHCSSTSSPSRPRWLGVQPEQEPGAGFLRDAHLWSLWTQRAANMPNPFTCAGSTGRALRCGLSPLFGTRIVLGQGQLEVFEGLLPYDPLAWR